MMDESTLRYPEIVVGIDVGQTCSGVAYSIGPDWCDPRILNTWPSAHGMERADKVATRVGYRKRDNTLAAWGFQCAFGDPQLEVREQFKLALDADYEDDRGFSCDHARQWYADYLICLHHEIVRFFDASIPRWKDKQVEYSFSMPTTWKHPAMIASIEDMIKKAGFADGRNQSVRMALTEAEAAAIEAATTSYRQGDIFMIVDAGGGTTDVNVMRVKSVTPSTELEPLDHVEGESIGSTLIDFRMGQHIADRLELVKDHLRVDVLSATEEMLSGTFQTVKHSFPTPTVDSIRLEIRGLPGRQSFPEAGIEDSKMIILRTTLEDIFNEQIKKIFALIDERLEELKAEYPTEQLTYIILSGGLGSSPYLYEELRRRYERNFNFKSSNTRSTRVMKVQEPQLAVVRGLVKERTQYLGSNSKPSQEVFKTRRCRNSYGITIRLPYDETDSRHWNVPTIVGNDGNRWIEHVVDWFIKKGEKIDVEHGVRKHYLSSIAKTDLNYTRYARVVMSTMPANQLPFRFVLGDNKCRDVASVRYQLIPSDMRLQNRQFWKNWKFKKQYWKAEFDFVIKPGPADLTFQVVGENGVVRSGIDSIKVDYMDPSEGNNRAKQQVVDRMDSAEPIVPAPHGGPGTRTSMVQYR